MEALNKIEYSRLILELGDAATLKEIQESYRRLCKTYHPDRANPENKKEYEEMLKEINNARETIMKYLECYRYSFRKNDIYSGEVLDAEYVNQFFDGWVSKK